ncbi:nucleolar protein 14 homolog [Aricia agestis]|uniref:nucleolar protein 14 homolog n=1 Tax=Aricia agestis TaxID=91739 RepID=UPI001C2059DD|nr:nucleolar protein 14 homolog [Aricia agestis]
MAKVKNKRNANLADKVHKKRKADANKKKLNPFEVHINREKLKVLGKKSKHDRGLPGVSRAKAIQKRKETLGTEMKLMHKTNAFIDRRVGEKGDLSAEDKMLARFASERAKHHSKKSIYNLADDEILTHRGQTLEQIEKFDDPRSSDDEDEEKKFGGLDNEFVGEGHFGGGFLSKSDTKDGAKSHKDLIEQLIAESKKRKAEKQKEKEETLDLTEKLDSEWKDLQPVVFKRARVEEESIIDKLLKKADAEKGADYDKMMRELKFEKRGTPSDGLKSQEKSEAEERKKLEELERQRQQRMFSEEEISAPKSNQATMKHRSADDLDDGFALDDEKEFMLAYDNEGKPLVPEHILKDYSVPPSMKKFNDGVSDTSDDDDEEEEGSDESGDDENDEDAKENDDDEDNKQDDDKDEKDKVGNDKKKSKNDDSIFEFSSDDESDANEEIKPNKKEKVSESQNKKEKRKTEEKPTEESDEDSESDDSETNNENVKNKETVTSSKNEEQSSSEEEDDDDDENVKESVEQVKNKQDIEMNNSKLSIEKVQNGFQNNSDLDSEESSDESGDDEDDDDNVKNRCDEVNRLQNGDKIKSGSEAESEDDNIGSFFNLKGADFNFNELLADKSPAQQSTAIEKLIKKYDPSLAENNKDILSKIYAHLLQYVNDIFSNLTDEGEIIKSFLIFNKIVPHMYDLAQKNKVSSKKFMVELLKEKHDRYRRNPRRVPNLDTLIFFKLVSLLYPTSDFRHPVTTPSLIFMTEILRLSKFRDAYSISRGLFVVSLVLEYTVLSKRYVPSAVNFLRGIFYLCANTSILNPVQVVPPFRLHKDLKILKLECDCTKLEVEPKMAAKDLISELDDKFKIRCFSTSVLMIKEFFNNYNDMEPLEAIFEPHLQLLSRVDLDLYPKWISKMVVGVINHMKETLEVKTYTLMTAEKVRPKALRLYDPEIQEVFTGKKHTKLTKEKAEQMRLEGKYKKEMKGALREIRRDKSFIASVKIKQKIQSDNVRKEKVKQIYKDASVQQGELNKLKRMK